MKFKKGLAALVALMLLSSTSVAFAMNAVVSEIKSYYKSPLISSGTSYSVNQFGQTYGSALYADTFDERPDLMAAIGDDGVAGYIYTDDLKSENPKTPAEAVARQEMYEALIANWDGQEAIVVRTIPLYESDGRTVIGDYNISFTPSDGNWNW